MTTQGILISWKEEYNMFTKLLLVVYLRENVIIK
jgi:hypothetical protein